MIIKRVVLENFLSHEKSSIEFQPGVTLIVGPNGAGKTSIIDAITYALFSDHSRGRRGEKEQLVRLGTPQARIELEFEANGKTYRIRREIPRKGNAGAYLFENTGKNYRLIAQGPKQVEAEVSKIIALPATIARNIIVAKQGELDQIISSKQRREYIKAVLQLEAIEKTYDRLRELIKEVEKKLNLIRGSLQEKEAQYKLLHKRLARLGKLLEEKKRIEDKLTQLRKQHENLIKEKNELEAQLKSLEGLEAEQRSLERTREKLQTELAKRIEELRGAENAAKELAKLSNIIKHLAEIKKYKKILEQLSETMKKIEKIDDRIARLREDLEELEGDPASIAARLRLLKTREEELRLRVSIYENSLALKREYEARLERIKNQLEELRNTIMTKVKEKLRLRTLGVQEPERIYKLIVDYKDKLRSDIDKRRSEIENLREKLGRLASRRENLQQDLDKLASARGLCPLCGQQLTEEHRISLIKKLREEREKISIEEKQTKTRIASLEKELAMLITTYNMLEELASEIGEAYHRIIELKRQRKEAEEKLREAEKNILAYTTAKKEYEELVQEINNLMELYQKLTNTQNKLIELKALERQKHELEEQIARLEAEKKTIVRSTGMSEDQLARMADEIEWIEEQIGWLKAKAAEVDELKKQVRNLQEEINEINNRLSQLIEQLELKKRLEEKYAKLDEELAKKENEMRELNRKLGELEGSIKQLEEDRKRLEELGKEIEKLKREQHALEKAIIDLQKIRSLFSSQGLPRIIWSYARKAIENIMKNILQEFNIDFVDIKISDDFEIYLVHRNGERSLQMMSGGERTAVAIAFRLALARLVAPRIHVLIMDEPTVHLDEENRKELVRITRWSISSLTGVHQLIIVSHDRELEEAADNIIEVVKEAGKSIVRERSLEGLPTLLTEQT
ncbi:MAG: AAA family ATPase [Pyrodictiaceae archaeon]